MVIIKITKKSQHTLEQLMICHTVFVVTKKLNVQFKWIHVWPLMSNNAMPIRKIKAHSFVCLPSQTRGINLFRWKLNKPWKIPWFCENKHGFHVDQYKWLHFPAFSNHASHMLFHESPDYTDNHHRLCCRYKQCHMSVLQAFLPQGPAMTSHSCLGHLPPCHG